MNIYIGEPVVVSDMQGPCPDGFHVPLKTDFDDLISCMTTFGLNTAGYYQSMLKMPNNGFRQYSDGVIYNTDQGRYWTSSASTGTEYAYHLVFSSSAPSSTVSTSSNTKEYGYNIRPFKDTPVVPDSSWTELYSNSIYHNSTLGLISIKNGSSWITISDKNLGATVVFNSGDTVTADNGGTWYQRGNNYGFPRSGSVTTSSTQVNTTGYGPGNYYSRNVFVVSSSLRDWSNPVNDNLRGGVSQGTSTKSVEVQNIYIGEYGWKPGANTLAYYKFDGNLNDSSGNSRNLTGGTTFNTLSSGKKVAHFDGTSSTVGTVSFSDITITDITFAAWIKKERTGTEEIMLETWRANYDADYRIQAISSGTLGNIGISYWYSNSDRFSGYNNTGVANGEWRFVVSTVGSDGNKFYQNGSQIILNYQNGSSSSVIGGRTVNQIIVGGRGGLYFQGDIGDFIVENKARTAQEISDYYNLTKSNYGL